jgi:hypothetical protein
VETCELGEGEEQSWVALKAGQEPSVVAQPGNGPFDFPALAVALQHAAVLSGVTCSSAFAMRTEELDAVTGQAIAQWIGVRRAIINPSRCMLIEDMIVEQRFNESHFGRAGAVEIEAQRQTLAVDEQHQLAALTALRGSDAFAPFFAGTNVASAIATCQSIRPLRSSLCSIRRQASSKTPLSIHSASRRQQVV